MKQTDTYSAFMLDYAAGNLPPALALAADIHVALTSDGRARNDLWETVGGVLLDSDPAPRTTRARAKVYADIDLTFDEVLGTDLAHIDWNRSYAGTELHALSTPGCKFLKIPSNASIPTHGHSVLEATVVLSGSFEDEFGRYDVGDINIAEPGTRHQPRLTSNDTCFCFVAREPSRLAGVIDWLGQIVR